MAKSLRNVVTYGLSGLIGELLVFRQRTGKTIVANRPVKTSNAPTERALEIRKKFKDAVIYAKSAMADPLLKAAYQMTAKGDQSAFNMAFADFQKSPEIEETPDFGNYTGAVGEELRVSVIDNFKVVRVAFRILSSTDEVLEEGEALQAANELDWLYTSTTAQGSISGAKVEVSAWDLPGNKSNLTVEL